MHLFTARTLTSPLLYVENSYWWIRFTAFLKLWEVTCQVTFQVTFHASHILSHTFQVTCVK